MLILRLQKLWIKNLSLLTCVKTIQNWERFGFYNPTFLKSLDYHNDNWTDNIPSFKLVNQSQLGEVQMKRPKVDSRLYLDDLTKKMTCKLYSSLVKALQECGNGVWSVWPLFYETFSFLLKAQYILVLLLENV